jgi:hypothetical protein
VDLISVGHAELCLAGRTEDVLKNRSEWAGKARPGDEVEAGAECVCDHVKRPHQPNRQLTDVEVGSTVNRTVPPKGLIAAASLPM